LAPITFDQVAIFSDEAEEAQALRTRAPLMDEPFALIYIQEHDIQPVMSR
jgi:hypothetical protein